MTALSGGGRVEAWRHTLLPHHRRMEEEEEEGGLSSPTQSIVDSQDVDSVCSLPASMFISISIWSGNADKMYS